jgi:hypothetical protein
MFFRRERPKELSFDERLESVRKAGFKVARLPDGGAEMERGGTVVEFEERDGAMHRRERTGVRIGNEIGYLVDGGYQKFFRTRSGRERPALASDLAAIHDFEEDLREALGLVSLYNEALGTVSTFYLYDRVADRDRGVPKRAWEN